MDRKKLATKAFLGVLSTPFFIGAPLFLAAGTLEYWEGWVFLLVFTLAISLHTLDLLFNDPEVLMRRMRAGPKAEQRPAQRIVISLIMAGFFLFPVIAGLDRRFHWTQVPVWLVVLGDCLVVVSYIVFYVVLKQNRFAAATIEIAEEQKVADTGLYGIVRHPMYSGALWLMIATALALGSYWALLANLVVFPALHWRIVDEERLLIRDLDGYEDYCRKVRYRLIPGVY